MALIAGLEDEPLIVEQLGWAFGNAGWEWRHLVGGPGLIDAIAAFRPDIVTTGNRHPFIGGIELLQRLKEREDTRMIPVVFVTAVDREGLWEIVRAKGLDPDRDIAGFVRKPFYTKELQAEIRRVLEANASRI